MEPDVHKYRTGKGFIGPYKRPISTLQVSADHGNSLGTILRGASWVPETQPVGKQRRLCPRSKGHIRREEVQNASSYYKEGQ